MFGYFALPVLVGDDIVAALDLKTDRKSRKLLVQKWNWVGAGAHEGARKDLKAPDRARAAPFRTVSTRGVREAARGFCERRYGETIKPQRKNNSDTIGEQIPR